MKKSVYKSAMSRVRTSEDFKEATYQKLMMEQENNSHNPTIKEERIQMEKSKKKLTGWAVGIAACAFIAAGIISVNQQHDAPASVPTQQEQAANTPDASSTSKPATTGKVQVNIDGVISEVSEDGKSFKVNDVWVTVTPDTIMGIDGPTAAEPSDELLQKEFKVGNVVSGFTTDDLSTGKVNATRIYNNMVPQK
ncbi:hypothetical protein [Paenibacillus glycanilyticus]|uniref:DUF5666 domain-containing protein n=1 Tax=Paenibacillus glycanilyticus TaxID=126569 RepID=A0ABQ6GKC0_9BACL|nr:hypothetical protein [Paenibacillus glycanilyticus]GLX69813.1 hypothetical protein MU1_41590 [Paenibacillus glycanilyticus]